MSERLTPVETARVIRAALRDAFPGTKFSLTNSRGTGYGYMDLTWTDGPTTAQVETVTDRYLSERLSAVPDDSTERVAGSPYTCRGVLSSRNYSDAARAAAMTDPVTWLDATTWGDESAAAYRYLQGVDLSDVAA